MKLQELKEKLLSMDLPISFQLNNHTFIKDVPSMIDSHIQLLEANRGNIYLKPYYNRLVELYDKINN